jgi:senataxin
VILVGDHKQLPATTFSENSIETNFSRSLFERMLQGGVKKYMLRVQYRMHPVIRQFPSDTFYGGLITDGNSIKTRQLDPVMTELSKHFRQVVFIDLADSNEKVQDLSKINITEAIFTFYLLKTLLDLSGLRNQGLKAFKNRIAIITPYKG